MVRFVLPAVRIFIYEFTCAGGIADLPACRSLAEEGWAMLSAAVEDFSRLSGVEVCGLIDEGREFQPAQKQFRRTQPDQEEAAFRELARQADYSLVVAPELNDILATRCRWVEEAGGRLLGPSAEAVRLTADKLTLARHLRQHHIPMPPSEVLAPESFTCSIPFPLVCKPRFGAGSLATFLVKDAKTLVACRKQAQAEGWPGEMLVQPFVRGQSVSVSFLIGPGQRLPLLPAAQNLSTDGRFHYQGGSLPLPADLAHRAVRLASRAVDAVPSLSGYVGVDLVLGNIDAGGQDWIIEINPRLTTSYIGLRALAEANLAEVMLRLAEGETVPPLQWRPGVVHFRSDGVISRIA